MNPVDYNEVYKAKFGEYLPLFLFLGMSDKEVLAVMQKAVETGKPVDTEKILEADGANTVI
jgi:hypothetical protein